MRYLEPINSFTTILGRLLSSLFAAAEEKKWSHRERHCGARHWARWITAWRESRCNRMMLSATLGAVMAESSTSGRSCCRRPCRREANQRWPRKFPSRASTLIRIESKRRHKQRNNWNLRERSCPGSKSSLSAKTPWNRERTFGTLRWYFYIWSREDSKKYTRWSLGNERNNKHHRGNNEETFAS